MVPVWTLEQALPIIRKIAKVAKKCGLDMALRGSVLLRGESRNDLDLLLIVEDPEILNVERCLREMRHLPEVREIGYLHPVGGGRNATVWLRDGKRIEARFPSEN
jgi:hypothetical protein